MVSQAITQLEIPPTTLGLDDKIASHIAHLFIRDPLVQFSETIEQDDSESMDHFENIQSTNWQTIRFKPPPVNSPIGWRVEFRSMEIQMTDFENAAFSVFIVLLTRAIISFDLNFYMPISLVCLLFPLSIMQVGAGQVLMDRSTKTCSALKPKTLLDRVHSISDARFSLSIARRPATISPLAPCPLLLGPTPLYPPAPPSMAMATPILTLVPPRDNRPDAHPPLEKGKKSKDQKWWK